MEEFLPAISKIQPLSGFRSMLVLLLAVDCCLVALTWRCTNTRSCCIVLLNNALPPQVIEAPFFSEPLLAAVSLRKQSLRRKTALFTAGSVVPLTPSPLPEAAFGTLCLAYRSIPRGIPRGSSKTHKYH